MAQTRPHRASHPSDARDLSITCASNDEQIRGYYGADWAAVSTPVDSQQEYTFPLNNAAIIWQSKRQKTVALNSTEVEYMAAIHVAKKQYGCNHC